MNRPVATQLIFVVAAVLIASVAPAQETVTRGERLAIDIAADGRIVMNLAGSVWILPGTGGEARLLDAGPGPVEHPRWSPDASRIVFGATVDDHHGIWLHDLVTGETQQVSAAQDFDRVVQALHERRDVLKPRLYCWHGGIGHFRPRVLSHLGVSVHRSLPRLV